jgi:predicted ATPase/class 3 adenylate cyclase
MDDNQRTSDNFPSGTVTFLFTDIEGSTRLAQQYHDAMPVLLARHHQLLHQSIQSNHGFIFQIIGDAFCAAFPTVPDAFNAAIMAQRSLQHEDWDPAPVWVRMGIHTGEAQASMTVDRSIVYRGYLTLARVQSVMSGAHGGQVLLSNVSAELVRDRLPEGILLRDMGEHRLKGEVNLEHLWQPVASDLRADFPPLKTLSGVPNNLPVQLTSFIGREQELAQTKEFLAHTHLLTLIGPGGTGKTRLALRLGADAFTEFGDGAWLVELAPLADPGLVLQTVATALGLREIPGIPLKDLVTDYLHERRLLLILDNCEHLVEACVGLVDHLLRHCSNLEIIASSREALGISGETVYRVPPLTLPDPSSQSLEALRQSEAIQLFIERAAASKAGFRLNEHNAPALAQICQRLDGIPLAIELAAARVGMLTPQQIATRLDDRFRLLTGGSRTALPRQQTLRSLIDWSYDLLSEPERRLFCQLAVFVGGWSLEAAEAIYPNLDVLDILAQLIRKSLVVVDEGDGAAETRFRLLETIRQYARDRLLEMENAAQVRDRHLDFYLKFAEAGERNIFGPDRLEWVNRCELEHDNFRAALQWGLEYNIEAALRLSGSLAWFWGARGYGKEGRRWLQAALDKAAAMPELTGEAGRQRQAAQVKCLLGSGQMAYGDGDYRNGLDASQEAVRIYRQLGDWFSLAFALSGMGNMAAFQNDMALAEQALTEAIQISREHGNKLMLCYALGVMSRNVLLPRGDIAAARAYAEESMICAREIGLEWGVAQTELLLAIIALINKQLDEARTHALAALNIFWRLRDPLLINAAYIELGDIELCAGNLLEAQKYHRQCILAIKELGHRAYVAHELESFAFIAHAQNQPERAARLLGAAEGLREGIGISVSGIERLEDEYQSAISWLKIQFDEEKLHTFWSEGCAFTVDQAIAYSLVE